MILGSNTARLFGSRVEYMGRVEVFDRISNQWGTICYNDVLSYRYWYHILHTICKSLGYYSYRSYGRASDYSNIAVSSNSPIVTGSIRCTYPPYYVYQNVYHCSNFESQLGISASRCTSNQELIVVCARKFLLCIRYLSILRSNHIYSKISITRSLLL